MLLRSLSDFLSELAGTGRVLDHHLQNPVRDQVGVILIDASFAQFFRELGTDRLKWRVPVVW
jgi:hypothetical protein